MEVAVHLTLINALKGVLVFQEVKLCMLYMYSVSHSVTRNTSLQYVYALLFVCIYCANVQTPADGPTGGLCPAGSYCPPASSSPLPCPPGTFSNSTGLGRPEECVSCPPG